jgi:hypothetical protein
MNECISKNILDRHAEQMTKFRKSTKLNIVKTMNDWCRREQLVGFAKNEKTHETFWSR